MHDGRYGQVALFMMPAQNGTVSPIRTSIRFAIGLVGLLLLTWLIYRPGLSGSFLFDDFVNLNALGATGPVHDWPSLLRYLTSGGGDPTGRPLTLLTFLLNAQDWPADPLSFKLTNVLLHLLNGALLCWAMLKLGDRTGLLPLRNRAAALLGTATWLLHPLLVSTTLYVVQREAMLPATFTLCGLLCWCAGRDRLDEGRIACAWGWMATGSLLCTLLATLCKANGILLPLLIAAAEWTVLRSRVNFPRADAAIHLRRQRLCLLGVPTALLTLYLLAQFPAYIHSAAEHRSWTIGQRLLSEPRVVMSYLRLLWLPRANSQGIFNDQTAASVGWLTPWTTLPCMLAILALGVLGWHLRKRRPIVAFAILFYFAGQLMESTFVPLELFFEHRNYLPAVFMFWPLAVWLTDNKNRLLRRGLAILILIIMAGSTAICVQVWGNSRQQALIWGKINPDSARAQAFAATTEMADGHYSEAISRLRIASAKEPNEVQLTLNLIGAECATGNVSPDTWRRVLFSLQHTTNGSLAMFDWFVNAIQRVHTHTCDGLTLQGIQQALQAARANTLYGSQRGRRQDFSHIAGLVAMAQGKPEVALADFNRALLDATDRGTALEQAAALGAAGYPSFGLRHLAFAQTHIREVRPGMGMPWLHEWLLSSQGYWQHETAVLHATLATDAATQAATHPPSAG
jgi:tetratricopeptide (TPR) repeat protein